MSQMNDLLNDQEHAERCHDRWMARRNRRQEDPEYRDEWYGAQCLHCRFWIPVVGVLGSDYGVCSNSVSAFDGHVRFEHDGCIDFEDGDKV